MQCACGLLQGPVCVADPYYRPDGTAFDLLLKPGTIVCTLLHMLYLATHVVSCSIAWQPYATGWRLEA